METENIRIESCEKEKNTILQYRGLKRKKIHVKLTKVGFENRKKRMNYKTKHKQTKENVTQHNKNNKQSL